MPPQLVGSEKGCFLHFFKKFFKKFYSKRKKALFTAETVNKALRVTLFFMSLSDIQERVFLHL